MIGGYNPSTELIAAITFPAGVSAGWFRCTQLQLGVYFITKANHHSTCADTSPDITHIPSGDGGNIYLAELETLRVTDKRGAEGEDVAEGVQDMHAPHGGGGEFSTRFLTLVCVCDCSD